MNAVTILCTNCTDTFAIDRDDLREVCDGDGKALCPGCAHMTRPQTAVDIIIAVMPRAGSASLSDMVVRAWHLAPERFGLPGYHHPDSNRVLMEVVKMSRPNGTLEKIRKRTYRLTERGRARAAQMRTPEAVT